MSETSGAAVRGRALSRELGRMLALIGREQDRLSEKGQELPPGADWLLDNWYLIEREGKLAASELRRAGRLRASGGSALIVSACRALADEDGGAVTARSAARFLADFQRGQPLTMRELGLFAPALRFALVGKIAGSLRGGLDAGLLSRCIGSLRLFSTLDLTALLEGADLVEAALRRDPAGVYPQMDERSRAACRERVRVLAKRRGLGEAACAERLLTECGEGGVCELLSPPERSGRGLALAQLLPALALSALLGLGFRSLPLFFLALPVLWELGKAVCDFVLLRVLPPRPPFRLELASGVPAEGRCLCVVSSLLSGPESGPELARRIEEFSLASRDCGKNLMFGLLADLPEARERALPGDGEATEAAVRAVEALNDKYGGGFFLFCRRRTLRERDGVWAGHERKRGALLALARLLRGDPGGLAVLAGDPALLRYTKYILTLDADTRLLPGAARELIGAMLHPLNRPVFGPGRVVVSGHGLIHPRMGVELSSAVKTPFSRLMAGAGGTDPYGGACGEVWMDLTGRGGFAGKGILDVDALLFGCSDLPENLILSHDAVEGAILRGGYMSDTELTDGFPSKPAAYFRRLHRWVRGDWQNISFILRRGRNFAFAERWKLFDSLRRSLFAPFCLGAIVWAVCLPSAASLCAGLLAACSLCTGLLPALGFALFRRDRERLSSDVPHGATGRLLQILLRALLLPWEALTCLGAAALALWRMGVSKKNLLAWQTAAQSEGRARKALEPWPLAFTGLALTLLSPAPAGRAFGLVWLAAAFAVPGLGRQRAPVPPLPEADRSFLLGEAAKIWQYFAAFCGPEDNYLPPDNWQEQPPTGLAHRTSPTNIGLAMVSALAAADLGLCSAPEAAGLIERILTTCEALPKWRGHLYNWYDTRSLRPLAPKYVSTVDSGNFAACLAALRRGLEDYARPDLAARAGALYEAMDFRPLYDAERRLFRIGWDESAQKLSDGLYDLLSSEARLTGYLAVARGEAPRRHWRRLSRALVSKDGYRGMASWTGTMFEYLMPELFLPLCRDSLLWESARFCLYVQRRDRAGGGLWGQSESAFFSLDPSLSYRYKAHGCQSLALRRGMGADMVVSPYSSFLALAVEPRAAVRNLRRLCERGFTGRFGLWEAVDFTPSRTSGRGGESVRCVMSHHLGMSLAAIDNCLSDNIMCRRFMSDPAMSAHRCLLEERLPLGAVTLRRRGGPEPEKPARSPGPGWEAGGACPDAAFPRCYPVSNGVYHLTLASSGLASACAGGIGIYRGPDDPLTGPAGLRIYFETPEGRTDLLPLPGAAGGLSFSHAFRGGALSFEGESDALHSLCSAAVSARDLCEVRFVELKSPRALEGRLCLEFEPMLARLRDWEGHPAYWRLGLHAEVREGALLIRRLPRGEVRECWLCLCSNRPLDCRADALGEPLGWLSHPFVRASTPAFAPMSGSFSARFALAFGPTAEEAMAAASRGLNAAAQDFADLLSARAALGGMGARELSAALDMAGALVFPRYTGAASRNSLWRIGVSGDLPVVCALLEDENQLRAARELIRRQDLLRVCGVRSDLVFLTREGGDYFSRLARSVAELLQRDGLEAMLGAPGGVHTAPCAGAEDILKCAALAVDLSRPSGPEPEPPAQSRPPLPEPRRAGRCSWRWLPDGGFELDARQGLPPRAWSLPLTNGNFGCLAADCGPAGTWLGNARETRVDKGLDGDLASGGSEALLCAGESLFAGARVRFGFGWAAWEKGAARVTLFVPQGADARLMIIENAPADLVWELHPALAWEARDAAFVRTRAQDGALLASNPRGGAPELTFRAAFSCEAGLTASEAGLPLFRAELPGGETRVIACGFLPSAELHRLAEPERALALLDETKRRWAALTGRLKLKTPHPELDRYMNGWAVYQTLACRLLARTSIYQSGGAYGFRDQLQDAVNLLPVASAPARERILAACAHQYEEGDVMHWWHEGEPDRGVRTRCSDDLLWLPWAVCEYVEKTGERALLDELRPYLDSPPLEKHEDSRYEAARSSERAGTVLEHAALALRLVIRRGVGEHGLPLMGAGDWNDGMDQVGAAGRGESVWLAWFFAHTARRFAPLLDRAGDRPGAAALLSAASRLGRAAARAWDGQWFLRGYFDDGAPLGSSKGRACRTDSVAQSWAAFCAEAPPERVDAALDAALERLRDGPNGPVKLFDPPFGEGAERAGYISSYGPGFRENGGQYTHGAIWLALALLSRGRRAEGLEVLLALLPKESPEYGAEPYVLAADVYTNPERYGQAGWSWYTGSAGWYLRAVLEGLFGLRMESGRLSLPELPEGWELSIDTEI